MKIRFVEPTQAAKPDVPFVVGGVYRCGEATWLMVHLDGHLVNGYVFVHVDGDLAGYSRAIHDEERARAYVQGFEYVPDAELVIPHPGHAK